MHLIYLLTRQFVTLMIMTTTTQTMIISLIQMALARQVLSVKIIALKIIFVLMILFVKLDNFITTDYYIHCVLIKRKNYQNLNSIKRCTYITSNAI